MNESVVQGRLVAFVRISSLHSELESQKEIIARFASRTGTFIRQWYEDPDRPRWKAEQSDILRLLLEHAAERRFDWVILDKQSRLGTFNHFEFFAYMQKFIDVGIRVWSVDSGELTSLEIGTTFRQVANSHAELADQKQKAGNVARGMFKNAKQFRFNGGPCQYGYDRVCMSPGNVARHRLVEDGRTENPDYIQGSKDPAHARWFRRYTVIYPNGHTESLSDLPGKGNHDWYEYAVTVRTERIEVVRAIYKMYAEGNTLGGIAKHLNATRVDRSFQSQWHAVTIRKILECTLYGGDLEWKKGSRAAYQTISKDGQYVEAVWSKANPRSRIKKIEPEDRIRSDEHKEELRIVDQELIDKVRLVLFKRDAEIPQRKRSEDPDMWVREWLKCGHCGGTMRSQTHKTLQGSKRYTYKRFRCTNYARVLEVGGDDGCVNNTIRSDLLDENLTKFLEVAGANIQRDLASSAPRLSSLLVPQGEKGSVIQRLRKEMLKYVLERLPRKQKAMLGTPGGLDLTEVYTNYFNAEVAEKEEEIRKLEDQISQFALARVGMKSGGVADKKLMDSIAGLEAEVERKRSEIVPISHRITELASQLQEIEEAIVIASSHSKTAAKSQAAEALRKVLVRIDVYSRKIREKGRKNNAGTYPDRLVFHPVVGEPVEFKMEIPSHVVDPAVIARVKEIVMEQAKAGRVNLSLAARKASEEGLTCANGKPVGVQSVIKQLDPLLATLAPELLDPRSRYRRRANDRRGGG